MYLGSNKYKVFKAYGVSNPTATSSDWVAYWKVLNQCLEVR